MLSLRSIRPSSPAVIVCLILIIFGVLITSTLISSTRDYLKSQPLLAQYEKDCAGVTIENPHSASGPCYIVATAVVCSEPNLAGDDPTVVGVAEDMTGLAHPEFTFRHQFNTDSMPPNTRYEIQVWRGHVMRAFFGNTWQLTMDNPGAHTGILAVILELLSTVIVWIAALWMIFGLARGVQEMRRDSAPAASSPAEPAPRS